MTTHTPGPWTFGPTNGAGFGVWATSAHYSVLDHTAPGIDAEANARLIAAAPALLAALENLRTQLHAHVKLDVKRHYSLLVAEAAAGTAIRQAKAADIN